MSFLFQLGQTLPRAQSFPLPNELDVVVGIGGIQFVSPFAEHLKAPTGNQLTFFLFFHSSGVPSRPDVNQLEIQYTNLNNGLSNIVIPLGWHENTKNFFAQWNTSSVKPGTTVTVVASGGHTVSYEFFIDIVDSYLYAVINVFSTVSFQNNVGSTSYSPANIESVTGAEVLTSKATVDYWLINFDPLGGDPIDAQKGNWLGYLVKIPLPVVGLPTIFRFTVGGSTLPFTGGDGPAIEVEISTAPTSTTPTLERDSEFESSLTNEFNRPIYDPNGLNTWQYFYRTSGSGVTGFSYDSTFIKLVKTFHASGLYVCTVSVDGTSSIGYTLQMNPSDPPPS